MEKGEQISWPSCRVLVVWRNSSIARKLLDRTIAFVIHCVLGLVLTQVISLIPRTGTKQRIARYWSCVAFGGKKMEEPHSL